MADIDLKTLTPDTTIDDNALLVGADSQASASPSVYTVQTLREHIEASPNSFTTAQTITPLTDVPALTVRRNNGSQTSNVLMVQDESNNTLTAFDKDGKLLFNGSTSGTVTIQPAATAGTYSLTLPTNDGSNGEALLTDGNGVLSWGAVGGTPGGSDTQVQFNDGGSFGGDAGLTFNKTAKTITLGGGTVTTSSPVIDAAQTWNDGGVTFTGLKFNATDTASAAGSLLMDLQVGGASRLSVSKSGTITAGPGNSGSNLAIRITGTTENTGWFNLGSGQIWQSANGTVVNRWNGSQLEIVSSGSIAFSTSAVSSGIDTILTRRAAANLRLGAADAAAPVAQTLSAQSVAAGTTNTAGPNLTITGSQGTGTGAGGSIIFQVAPAGSSGTAQNALADALTIESNSRIRTTSVAGIGNLVTKAVIGSGDDTGLFFSTNAWIGIQANNQNMYAISAGAIPHFVQPKEGGLSWSSGDYPGYQALNIDVSLFRDAANTLALRNGANAQAFRVYNTFTSATEFERGNIFWDSNVLKIGTEKGSAGGTARALEFQTDGTTRLTIATSGLVTVASNLYAVLGIFRDGVRGGEGNGDAYLYRQAPNVWQIGREAQATPQNGTLTVAKLLTVTDVAGGSLTLAGGLGRGAGGGGSLIFRTAPPDASGTTENTHADRVIIKPDGLVAFAGATSSFPALKRSSTTLQARLADDSAFTNIQGKLTTETAYTAGAPTATGYLVLYDSNGTAYKVPAEAL
jgi:hypothetical protein